MDDGYDRTLWADYIRTLKDRRGMSVAELSRRTGFNRSTFFDWMRPDSRKLVTIQSILAVARAVGDDPVDAFKAAAGLRTNEPEDAEINVVLEAIGLTDDEREGIIAGILQRRERNRELDRQRDMDDTIQMIKIAGGKVA